MSFALSRSRILCRIAAVGLTGAVCSACSLGATRVAGLTPPQPIAGGNGQVQTAAVTPSAVQQTELAPLPNVPSSQPAMAGGRPRSTNGPAFPNAPTVPVSTASATSTMAPTATTAATATAMTSSPASPAGGSHTVTPGETLYSLGRRYDVSPMRIAEANGLPPTTHIRIGQTLIIPGASASLSADAGASRPPEQKVAAAEPAAGAGPAATGDAGSGVATADPAAGIAGDPSGTAAKTGKPADGTPDSSADPAGKVVEVAAETKSAGKPSVQQMAYAPMPSQEPARMSSTSFRWPVRGRVISQFGNDSSGQRNDGINLAAPEGSPVKAAENGVVVYAGNELKGYGNLILVRHEGDYVTAYAHASELLVKRGETVRRGQIIAKVGQTGSVNAPQLHFEIRKGPKPVNPSDYLAGA